MDRAFESEANNLLNEARNENKRTANIAGIMDGLSLASVILKEKYSLFVKTEEKEENEDKAIY